MDIKIAPNKLNENEAKLHVDNNQHVYTLIWENWCGKSSILETIFKTHENSNWDWSLIAYSSWKNERFSKLYKEWIKKIKREELRFIENKVNDEWLIFSNNKWFYFDKTWAPILIFLATMLKKNGKVRKFLTDKNYVNNEDEQDKSSMLSLRIRISKRIKNFIWRLREKSELDVYVSKTSQWSSYLTLENIITYFDPDYDFETRYKGTILINNENFYDLLKKDTVQDIDFFYQYWIIKNAISVTSIMLTFKNNISLEDLSDWEFQILTVYAILDLFDSENTIFLFDEIDSHLYYKKIKELRESLYQIQWTVITTTHIPDSILWNKIDSLRLVEKWNIDENATMQEVLNRMDSLTNHDEYWKLLASKCKYIALVEDQADWFIFTGLLKKFIWDNKVNELKKIITIIKYPSWIDSSSEIFWWWKKSWITDFLCFTQLDWIETKWIFCICDRDILSINDILGCKVKWKVLKEFNEWIGNHLNLPRKTKNKGINFVNNNVFLLSWRRKQIENYLLSYTMLNKIKKLDSINEELPKKSRLKKWDKLDNKAIQELEIKDKIKSLYSWEWAWINYKKLQEIIDLIPKEEVSDDIMYMYDFINSKLDQCDQK